MIPGLTGIAGFLGAATPPPTDPNYASTVLLLSGDGTNGSTTFTDQSFASRGNATVGDDTQVSTGAPKFGTGAIRFDGTVDNLTFADSADFDFASGNFTIETWAAVSGLGGNLDLDNTLLAHWEASGDQRSWIFRYNGSATNALQFLGSSGGTTTDLTVSGNWTPTADQYYHLCAERSSNDFRLYIDGVMLVKVNQSITLHNSTASFRLGARSNGGPTANFRGSLDEIRVTKGVARYASDAGFAVPTAAYPRS